MLPETKLEAKDFEALAKLDELIAKVVASERCVRCRGPLHVGNYARKPRGAALAGAGEAFTLRHSLCCGWCRKRTLPPSLRFLGRRVYLEVVVVFASVMAQAAAKLREAASETGVPARTLKRWLGWWREELPQQVWWRELRARFAPPPPANEDLPRSLVAKLAGPDAPLVLARSLAPGTTRSPIDVARFVRGVATVPT